MFLKPSARLPASLVARRHRFIEFVILLVVISSLSHTVLAQTDTGIASGIDGDSLLLNGVEHRLHGIDAVEADQACINERGVQWRCGLQAKRMLQSLLANQTTSCEWSELDRYNRRLSVCRTEGINLNVAMVYAGYAVAYRQYSDRYIDDENRARERASGIWSGQFLMPWEHRKRGRKVDIPVPDATRPIKGNINSKGKRYYHCPSDRSYRNTRISQAKGERWFASSLEAESAGWGRAPGAGQCQLN